MPDTIPDGAFLELFKRLCLTIRFGRTRNPGEIQKRIGDRLRLMRKMMRKFKKGRTIKRWRGRYNKLRTLYRKRFSERIWREAVENPGSIYDLTLEHGYERAKKILKERAEKRIGRLKRLKRAGKKRQRKSKKPPPFRPPRRKGEKPPA